MGNKTGKQIIIRAGALADVQKSASKSDFRHYICGVRVEPDGFIAATDTYRLAVAKCARGDIPEPGVLLSLSPKIVTALGGKSQNRYSAELVLDVPDNLGESTVKTAAEVLPLKDGAHDRDESFGIGYVDISAPRNFPPWRKVLPDDMRGWVRLSFNAKKVLRSDWGGEAADFYIDPKKGIAGPVLVCYMRDDVPVVTILMGLRPDSTRGETDATPGLLEQCQEIFAAADKNPRYSRWADVADGD